jgi:hypothetical protein
MNNVNVAAKAAEAVDTPTLSVVKKDQLFRLVSELNHDDFKAAGATEQELSRKQERMVAFDAGNAKLVFGNKNKGKIRDILIEGQILGSASLVSSELDYKILLVFTEKRTYFTLLPGPKQFGFFVPAASKNAREAVLNLISNNLAKGKDTFEKTATRLYPDALFLWELVLAVCPEDTALELKLANGVRGEVSKADGKLFIFRDDRSKSALTIGGYRYDFNFKDYPGNYLDAFKRVKVNQGKINHKLNVLTMDLGAQLKPKQKSRAEKNAKLDGAVTLPGVLTHGTLPFNPDAPVQEVKEKPVKEKKVAEKKAPAKEGKKKK